MILFDLEPTELDPSYQALQVSNLNRQYDFLRSIVDASLSTGRVYVSTAVIKAFNYHAIVCLHSAAGQFRACQVKIGDGSGHKPPDWIHVQALMDDFVNQINCSIHTADPVVLASYALWRLNWIHPFINGNGRTARLVCYYILCLRFGGMLAGAPSLPELLKRHRGDPKDPYVAALKAVDASHMAKNFDISALHTLIENLLNEQLASATPPAASNPKKGPKAP